MPRLSTANYAVAQLAYVAGLDASGNVKHGNHSVFNAKDYGVVGDGTLTDTAVAYDGGTWASAGAARAVVVPPGAYLKLTYSVVPTSMYGIVI
jgi:polygalacturonase